MMNSRSLRDLVDKVRGTGDWNLFNLRVGGEVGGVSEKFSLFLSYQLARNTHLFSDEVWGFIFDSGTYREISEKYGITEGVLKNKIFREVRDYYELVGMDLYYELKRGSLTEAEIDLIGVDLKEKYDGMRKRSESINDYFTKDIFTGSESRQDFSSISNDQYINARDIVSRLSIPANQFLVSRLDKKLIDYVAYLLTFDKDRMGSVDLERRENLIMFLKLEEYFKKREEDMNE